MKPERDTPVAHTVANIKNEKPEDKVKQPVGKSQAPSEKKE